MMQGVLHILHLQEFLEEDLPAQPSVTFRNEKDGERGFGIQK